MSVLCCTPNPYLRTTCVQAEVDTITTGDECGIGLLNYEDFEAGDIIESYVVK